MKLVHYRVSKHWCRQAGQADQEPEPECFVGKFVRLHY